jgi:hypothetical protein
MWISNVTTSGGINDFNNNSGCSSLSYTDYSSSDTASNTQLATTTISMTSNGYPLAFSVWIDYNDDGIFESSEQVVADNNTTEASTVTDNFTIPYSAIAGKHKMRVRADYYSEGAPTDPCSQLVYGETEDYGFTVIALTPCAGTPDPGNTISSFNPVCSGVNFTLSLQNNIIAGGISCQWQSSPDGSAWTNISGATNDTLMTSQTTATYYRCIVTCTNSGLSSNSTSLYVTMNSSNNCYCTPTVIDCNAFAEYGNYLSQVSLNGSPDMVNNTGHTNSSTQCYTFYSPVSGTTTTTLFAGSTYSFGAQCGETDENYVSAWIDFNEDGVFSSSEMIANGIYLSTANTTYSSSFTVPASAVNGTVRMRVILNYDMDPTDPCGTYNWADVEDYEITLVNTPCSGTPDAGTVVSTANPVCSGIDFTLSLTGTTMASGLSYQWQSSPDSSTWTNISGATNATLTNSQLIATYYRCIVTCSNSGLSSNSISLYVTMNQPNNCYCIPLPSTYFCNYMWISNVTTTGGMTNFNNSSGCSDSSYTDYSNTYVASNSQLDSTTISFTSSGYPMAFAVWIDFNDDGVFEPSEKVITDSNLSQQMTVTDKFAVPLSAFSGTHRMRVRGDYYTVPPTGPCSKLNEGETEDYSFTVVCSVIPLSHPPAITQADSFLISNVPTGNQWYHDNTIIPGATDQVYISTLSGYYYSIVSGVNGCVSDTSNVICYPTPSMPTITQHGDTLISSVGSGYQWYYNDTLILWATSQSYSTPLNGTYTVEITNSYGCKSMSAPYKINNAGIDKYKLSDHIIIYPNPASNNIIIECPVGSTIEISDVQGQLVTTFPANKGKMLLDVSAFSEGVYIVEVKTGKGLAVKRFIKE